MLFKIRELTSGKFLAVKARLPTPSSIQNRALKLGKHVAVFCKKIKIFDTRFYLPNLEKRS